MLIFCSKQMSASDVDQIYSTVSAFGGGYRAGVTQDVTHIVARRVEVSPLDGV